MRNALIVLLLLIATASPAQEMPTAERLIEWLHSHPQVPAFWTINDVRIVGSMNVGTPVDPIARQRFEVDVRPNTALFRADPADEGVLQPHTPVIPTVAPDERHVLYGTLTSIYRAGQWLPEFSFENSVEELGKPRDLFDGPTVVRGSEEEKQLRATLLAARQADRQFSQTLERLEADHLNQIAAVKQQNERAVQSLNAEHRDQIESLKRKHEQQVQFLTQALEQEEKGVAGKLKLMAEANSAELARAEDTYRKRAAEQAGEFDREMAMLTEQQERAKKELLASHKQDIVVLRERLVEAEELRQLNESYAAKLEELRQAKEFATSALQAHVRESVLNAPLIDAGLWLGRWSGHASVSDGDIMSLDFEINTVELGEPRNVVHFRGAAECDSWASHAGTAGGVTTFSLNGLNKKGELYSGAKDQCPTDRRMLEMRVDETGKVYARYSRPDGKIMFSPIARQGSALSRSSTATSLAPSFDCSAAKNWDEKLICSSDDLARLDNDMVRSYRAALATTGEQLQKQVKSDQLTWIKRRRSCVDERNQEQCIRTLYTARIEQLKRIAQ